MSFKPSLLASAIGSMPHTESAKAVELSLSTISNAPIWPQLPKLGLNEQMEIQYSEAMPGIQIDRDKGRMFFDTETDFSEKFAEFYEAYMAVWEEGGNDLSYAAISEDFSKGIYELEKKLETDGKKLPFVKVQVTGPCSFGLTIVDENKRAIYYNEEYMDMVVKAIAMKARWQIQKFQKYAEKVICFIDEPILSAFGSSTYVSVKREDVVAKINEVVEAVHMDNALAGVHCCGNTEWSILIDAGVDIVNFDAYEYGETIAIYADQVKPYLDNGGTLAWGVIPTSAEINKTDVDGLVKKLEEGMDNLASKGIDIQKIREQALITPSCGTGSMSVEDAEKVFDMTAKVSAAMKEKHGI